MAFITPFVIYKEDYVQKGLEASAEPTKIAGNDGGISQRAINAQATQMGTTNKSAAKQALEKSLNDTGKAAAQNAGKGPMFIMEDDGAEIPIEQASFIQIDNFQGSDLPLSRDKILTELNSEENALDEAALIPDEINYNLNDISPMYIVGSFTGTYIGQAINYALNSKYSHIGVSFDLNLNRIYSFCLDMTDLKNFGGFVIESLGSYWSSTSNAKICVIAVFLKNKHLNLIKRRIQWYIQNKNKTSYAKQLYCNVIHGMKLSVSSPFQKVCSTFTYDLFKDSINVDLMDNQESKYNLITPHDLLSVKNSRLYHIYEGKVKDYNPKSVGLSVQNLKKGKGLKLLKESIEF